MFTPDILARFSALLQKATLPGVWSKGVAMSRECPVLVDSRADDEITLRIQVPGRPISPKIMLWPEEEDWHCDCGDRNDPCLHVVAAAVALKTGLAKNASPEKQEAKAHFEYRFTRKSGALDFERWIYQPDGKSRQLVESLVSWVGGIHSGRIHSPVVPATKQDFAVDAALGSRKTGLPDRETLARLLPLLHDAPHVTLDGSPIAINKRPTSLVATIYDEGTNSVRLRIALPTTVSETFSNGAVITEGALSPLLSSSVSPQEKIIPTQELMEFASELLPSLHERIPVVNESTRLPDLAEDDPGAVLRIHELEKDTISVLPVLVYGNPPYAEIRDGRLVATRPTALKAPIRRREQERKLYKAIQNELQISPYQSTTLSESAALEFLERARNWEKQGEESNLAPREELTASFSVTTEGDVALNFGGADTQAVFRAWQAGTSFVRLLDGGWAKLPKDWLNRHGEKVLQLLQAREKTGALPKWFLPDAIAVCEELGGATPPVLDSIRKALEAFTGIPESPLPADLQANLRGYQRAGINWLSYLTKNGMGALLADDMGLGKTLQTLCAIQGKTLVVAPTSVMHGWASQMERFRPSLRFHVYHGAQRRLDPQADVTITTYAILRLDQELLTQTSWDTVVLDEAQVIRNPESQIARAAHQLQAKARIALTGTPIENRLEDLWSQFQFLNPALLGSRQDFQDRYSGPIDGGSASAQEALRKRIRPFVLRRLKSEVAPELPPRTESVLYCELNSEERATYESVLAASRAEALKLLESGGSPLGVLETLLRLRQACCHTGLLPGITASGSSKLELLLEYLETSISENHRALVFSQWTSLLDLIEPGLREKQIGFLRLDGSTPNRSEVVSRFQDPSGPPVLLVSLKAGGVGLTLTAADHVYLLDPWWNPSVENQAADRAHRIGQEKPVMIYRLAARNTVEEKVLELQEQKLRLAKAVLEGTEGASSGALELTREDLLTLIG